MIINKSPTFLTLDILTSTLDPRQKPTLNNSDIANLLARDKPEVLTVQLLQPAVNRASWKNTDQSRR